MDKKLSIKTLDEDYEAPFAEIVEVDLKAIMTWSGIHQTFDQSEAETGEDYGEDETRENT